MITTFDIVLNVLRQISVDVMTVLYYCIFAKIFFKEYESMSRERIFIGIAINMLVHVLSRYFLYASFLSVALVFGSLVGICWIMWQPTNGLRFTINFLIALIIYCVYEYLLAYVFNRMCPPQMAYFTNADGSVDAHYYRPAGLIVFTVYTFGLMALFVAAFVFVRKLYRLLNQRMTLVFRLARPIAFFFVLTALCSILYRYMYRRILAGERYEDLTYLVITFLLALILLFSYVIQDFNHLRLQQKNQTLQFENVAYQRIIDSTREFRHNLANMIYGMEGVLITGDMDQIRRYYDEMEKRCALINNENMLAINRITNPAIVALLLRKIEKAQKQRIPFYLTAEKKFRTEGISDVSMCEVLGNVIDNALEAAEGSRAPRVNLTLNCGQRYDELILENTYAEDADMSFLTGDYRSTKEGHLGKGLASVHAMLKGKRHILFNQFQQGRYVVTTMCFYHDLY